MELTVSPESTPTTQLMMIDPEMQMLINNEQAGNDYQSRKLDDWRKNYEMWRDKVPVNRFIQRQSVHIPFMKQQLSTILKDVDDMPVVYFESLDNDKQKEVYKNEYWKETLDRNNMEIKDVVDKKQAMFFGRTFDQMQIIDGLIRFNIIAPGDIVVSRYVDPTDIDTSRFLIHKHIYTPLSTLQRNPEYNKAALEDMRIWYGTTMGLIKAQDNQGKMDEKNKLLEDLGVLNAYDPVLGETIVDVTMQFVFRENEKKEDGSLEDEQIYLYVLADNRKILMKKPLEEIIGPTEDHYWRNHYPYNTWADEVEMQDFWSDGKADTIRPANEILDVWFSQLVENRTLRSLGMNFFNSNLDGFMPQTWQPMPFGQYGIPIPPNSDIRQHIQRVEIQDLTESLDEMKYVQEMAERGTGGTATSQGVQTERKITLGEVQLALGEAKARIKGMSKFYTKVWEQRAYKFNKFIEADANKEKSLLDDIEIFKKGRNTDNIYSKVIGPKDFMGTKGYRVKIWAQADKDESDTQALSRMNAAMVNMPNNPILKEEFQRKLLEFSGIKPDKIIEIIAAQKKADEAAALAAQNAATMGGKPTNTPANPLSVAPKAPTPGLPAGA